MAHVVCSDCGTTNRMPAISLATSAKCGKCGQPLFDGEPRDVTGAILEKQIARSDIPVLVDIWAPWCGPCRVMGPQFEAAAKVGEPGMRFVKLNSDENQELAARLGIRGIPTMIMFRNGQEVGRVSGAMQTRQILQWAQEQAEI